MTRVLLCLLVVCASAASAAVTVRKTGSAVDQLQLVQVVIRHGDRAATDTFATDGSSKVLFRGLGELSDLGIDHAHKQGSDFKKRYVDTGFIDERFVPSQVRFRSSGLSRVLMSAGSFSNALFKKTSGGNSVVPPIYTKEYSEDALLAPALDCEDGWDDVIEALKLESNQSVAQTSLGKMEADMWPKNCKDVPANKVDAIIAELPNKAIKMPVKYQHCAEKPAKEFMYKYVELLGGSGGHRNDVRLKRTVGMLTNELIKNMEQKTDCWVDKNCTMDATERFRVYYSHDVNVLALSDVFNSIKFFDEITPAFSSAMVFELWNSPTTGPYVRVFLKNGQDAEFVDTGLCGKDVKNCSLKAIKKMSAPYAIDKPMPCERSGDAKNLI